MNFFKKIGKKEYFILGLILVLAFLLRAFHLAHQVPFDFDQEAAANFAHQVLKVYPLQLIGEGLSIQGLFMGPWYFYYLVPFFALTGLHPIGGFIGSVVLGLITIAAFFFLLRDVYGAKTGLVAAFFQAILFTTIQSDWVMSPGFSSQLGALVIWYCLYKIYHGKQFYFLPLGLFFGLVSGFFHPSLFPFYFVALTFLIFSKKLPNPKYFLGGIALFLLVASPLILFEYFRHFLELKTLFSINHASTAEIKTWKTLFDYVRFIANYPSIIFQIPGPAVFKELLSFAIDGGIVLLAAKKIAFWKDGFHPTIIILTSLVFTLIFLLLPTHVTSYYFVAIQTLVFVYISATLCLLLSKKAPIFSPVIFAVIIVALAIFNFSALVDNWSHPSPFALFNKEEIVQKISQLQPDNKMTLYFNADNGQQFGFNYLLNLYNVRPTGGDKTYIIVLPTSRTTTPLNFSSGGIGLVVSKPNKK